jgi:hypothetical protein
MLTRSNSSVSRCLSVLMIIGGDHRVDEFQACAEILLHLSKKGRNNENNVHIYNWNTVIHPRGCISISPADVHSYHTPCAPPSVSGRPFSQGTLRIWPPKLRSFVAGNSGLNSKETSFTKKIICINENWNG